MLHDRRGLHRTRISPGVLASGTLALISAFMLLAPRAAHAQVCTPTPEVCNGCDDDCDGVADNGAFAPVPCGATGAGEPAYCQGTYSCRPPVSVPIGMCHASGGTTGCSISPQTEVCDGLDNDCDTVIDNHIPGVACIPAGTSPGLVYGGTSMCRRGTTTCTGGVTQCTGFVGPSAEVCDGVDNNCDGVVDNAPSGVGVACGNNTPPCTAGSTACVFGALVCMGGVVPRPETCDGIDNDCNGTIDDGSLADAPAPSQSGCWDLAGNCCSFPAVNPTLHWCPPPGASCNDIGSLTGVCMVGTLACQSGSWICRMPTSPSPETCDGIDNDCNGAIDDAVPTVGNACTASFDISAFPGNRTFGSCHDGVVTCSGSLGCSGVGPQPETCNGLDDDCDGTVDESGSPPDGIDGTSDPAGGTGVVGNACNVGGCPGTWRCTTGAVTCVTATESCVDAGADSSVDAVEDVTSFDAVSDDAIADVARDDARDAMVDAGNDAARDVASADAGNDAGTEPRRGACGCRTPIGSGTRTPYAVVAAVAALMLARRRARRTRGV